MEMTEQRGDRLENILMTPGVEPRFTCKPYTCRIPAAKDLTASELLAFYLEHVPRKTFSLHMDHTKMNIWTTLFVAKGYKEGYSMEHVFGTCVGEEFARVGLDSVACRVNDIENIIRRPSVHSNRHSGVFMGTRSKRHGDSFAFESNENKIFQPSAQTASFKHDNDGDALMTLAQVAAKEEDYSALMTLAQVAATEAAKEEDYSDMPPLITVQHAKVLETLKCKEAALLEEAAELDRVEVKVKEVQALYDNIGPRRIIWCCEEMANGEAGLDKLKIDYENELAELDALESKVIAVRALKATVTSRREELIAAVNDIY